MIGLAVELVLDDQSDCVEASSLKATAAEMRNHDLTVETTAYVSQDNISTGQSIL